MRILEITSQSRRDYRAIMICEHCKHTQKDNRGYDDAFYHSNVIPNMVCGDCGKKASDDYKPNATKYSEDTVV